MAFITFEGIEGSGKTTQIKLLLPWLSEFRKSILHTREPGGTVIGDKIRQILLDPDHTEMTPQAEILLFSAARAQIVHEVIRPHLEQGWIVVCDRFFDSTLAYQGYGLGLALADLRQITMFATGGLKPDLTIYLDIDVERGLRRKAQTPQEWNRMEAKEVAFHERVRQGYLALAQNEPQRWLVIDGSQAVETIQAQIRERLVRSLELHKAG